VDLYLLPERLKVRVTYAAWRVTCSITSTQRNVLVLIWCKLYV
jgi:hypothetical protein